MKIEEIAKVAHEINAALARAYGNNSHFTWDEAPQWMKDSAIEGVEFHMENLDAAPGYSHECWMEKAAGAGWVYGETEDQEKKQHPYLVPFEEIPEAERVKDFVFQQVVRSLV